MSWTTLIKRDGLSVGLNRGAPYYNNTDRQRYIQGMVQKVVTKNLYNTSFSTYFLQSTSLFIPDLFFRNYCRKHSVLPVKQRRERTLFKTNKVGVSFEYLSFLHMMTIFFRFFTLGTNVLREQSLFP